MNEKHKEVAATLNAIEEQLSSELNTHIGQPCTKETLKLIETSTRKITAAGQPIMDITAITAWRATPWYKRLLMCMFSRREMRDLKQTVLIDVWPKMPLKHMEGDR